MFDNNSFVGNFIQYSFRYCDLSYNYYLSSFKLIFELVPNILKKTIGMGMTGRDKVIHISPFIKHNV
jgi:hypothetical protein